MTRQRKELGSQVESVRDLGVRVAVAQFRGDIESEKKADQLFIISHYSKLQQLDNKLRFS